MSVIDTILVILKRKNLKQKDLTDYLGISQNAFTDWKSGRIKSWQKYLPQIAEFLGVTVDELLGSPSNKAVPFAPDLDELRALYLALDPDDRATLRRMAEAMLAAPKYKKAPDASHA